MNDASPPAQLPVADTVHHTKPHKGGEIAVSDPTMAVALLALGVGLAAMIVAVLALMKEMK